MHLENLFLNPAYLAAFLFGLKISAAINMDSEIQDHCSLFKQGCLYNCSSVTNHLNIGQDNLLK